MLRLWSHFGWSYESCVNWTWCNSLNFENIWWRNCHWFKASSNESICTVLPFDNWDQNMSLVRASAFWFRPLHCNYLMNKQPLKLIWNIIMLSCPSLYLFGWKLKKGTNKGSVPYLTLRLYGLSKNCNLMVLSAMFNLKSYWSICIFHSVLPFVRCF